MSELNVLEIATLKALADECGYSLSGHAAKENVLRHFKGHLKGDAKKALEELRKKGLCTPVGGKKNLRYRLSRKGLDAAESFPSLPFSPR